MKYPGEAVKKQRSFKLNNSELSVPDLTASKKLLKRSEEDWLKYKKMFMDGKTFEEIFQEKSVDCYNFIKVEEKRVLKKKDKNSKKKGKKHLKM